MAGLLLGTPPPVRDVGLLGAAVARPQTTVLGEDAYGTIFDKAAALLQSLVNNHALIDGNKRLGWLATAVFLDLNGVDVTDASNDAVYDLIMKVAAGSLDVDEITDELRTVVIADN